MVEREIIVVNELGLHARPAVLLVKTAAQFESKILLRKDDMEVNAKSIMGVLILAAEKGCNISIIADGPDEEKAVEAMSELFDTGFGED